MTVDQLIDWFPISATWPGLTFLLAVLICAVPVFLFIAVYALVVIYGELKISSFMQDKVGPMGQGVGLHAWRWGLLQPIADALKLILKEDSSSQTNVIFVDLSEENDEKIISYSAELFDQIASKF